jgi:hypothetical protein
MPDQVRHDGNWWRTVWQVSGTRAQIADIPQQPFASSKSLIFQQVRQRREREPFRNENSKHQHIET